MTYETENCKNLDLNDAVRQLKLLGYTQDDEVSYRALSKTHNPSMEGQGFEIPEIFAYYQQREEQDYGIYLVVNGPGRKDGDIKECRAIFYEHDDLPKEEQTTLWGKLALPEPTFQVDTGGKSIHSYWVFDQPCSTEEWKSLQADLLDFAKADRTIKNPSRIMRLAGFKHQKTGEFSRLISESGKRYSFEELREIVPVTVREQAKPRAKSTGSLPVSEIPLTSCLSKKHRGLILNGAGEGERNSLGATLARDLIGTADYLQSIAQNFEGDARSLFEEYCLRCSPPLFDKECETIWSSAEKSSPSSCLSSDKIRNCIDAYYKKKDKQQAQRERKPLTDEEFHKWDLTDVPDEEIGSKTMQAMRAVKRALGEDLRLNELANQIEFRGKGLDPNTYKLFIAKLVDIDRPEADCTMILNAIAKKHAYHPVKVWLEKLNERYGEDTIDFLDGPASRYLHTENPLYNQLLRIQLIAAVKRVYEPGCKFDNAVVLQGGQNLLKSTFWSTLAGDDWFDDNLGEDVENKDSLMVLHGCWIEEWGEIDRITGKKEMGVVKSFLSRRVDTFRAPYERTAVKHPRRGVIVGSVNPDQFLKDDENRRMWVIPVTQRIDIDAVIRDREWIWAAAVALYKRGTPIYLCHEDEQKLRTSNTQFSMRDAWEEDIERWVEAPANRHTCNGKAYVLVKEILTDCLKKTEIGQHSGLDSKRVCDVLRRLGFKNLKNPVRLPGRGQVRVWECPITDETANTDVGITA